VLGLLSQQGVSVAETGIVFFLIPCSLFIEYYFTDPVSGKTFSGLPKIIRWGVYYLLVLLICYFGKFETNSFIYFRF
jgi:hypothetical protein